MRQRQLRTGRTAPPRGRAGATAWFWPALAMGAVVRLVFLDTQEFWHDEVLSLLIAGRPHWSDTVRTAARLQFGAAGYFAVLHAWLLTSRGEFMVRLLSVAGDLAALWAAFRLIEETLPPGARPAAGWLVALLPLSITYAKEVRGYSWLSALELAAGLSLWRGVNARGTPRAWAESQLYPRTSL